MSCPRRATSKILSQTFDPFMSQEAIDEAEKKLDDILEKAPDNTVLLQIGLTYLELGNPEKAEKALDKAEKTLTGNPAVHLFKAIMRYDQSNMAAAREELAKLETITPDNQALPTMKVLCDLHEGKIKEALSVLLPAKGKFDITVSPYISTRLAMELEEKMLTVELGHLQNKPGANKTESASEAAPGKTGSNTDAATENGTTDASGATDANATEADASAANTNAADANETDAKTASATDASATEASEKAADADGVKANSAETADEAVSASGAEATADSEEASAGNTEANAGGAEGNEKGAEPGTSGADTDTAEAASTDTPANADAKTSKEPTIPEGSALDLFLKDTSDLCEGTLTALSFKSSKRMTKAWEMPEAKRKEEVNLALRELKTIYVKDPKSFQAAYNLAEALLVATELNHERCKPYAKEELNKIRACGQLLEISRKTEGDNAYVKHYHARVHYLLGNFTEAERLWKEALDAFNKFPEAHYGLGQTLIALGKKRAARMMIGKSIMSDLHLLRDRINDLKEAYAN